jgi:hypothetical protein
MNQVNPKRVSVDITKDSHLNFMAGTSWDIKNPLTKLRIAASSCFFGEPQYYNRDADDKRKVHHAPACRITDTDVKELRNILNAIDPQEWRGMSPKDIMEKTIDEALAFNVEETLKVAVALRNDDHIRVTPQIILVRAANHKNAKGLGLVQKYAPQIIKRADEPATGLAYQKSAFGKPIPNSLKKAWAKALSACSEYSLAKYRLEGHQVKTVDVMNIAHPKSAAIGKLAKGELKNDNNTWEAIISKEGSNKESWIKALEVMPHMALLRNLRNLEEKGVDQSLYLAKLVAGAEKGNQLPFRYWSAFKAVEGQGKAKVMDAIEDCMKIALKNLPHFDGNVMSLCDNSGSAQGATTSAYGTVKVSEIANLTAVITAKCADNGFCGVFGDRLETFSVRQSSSVFDDLKKANELGGGIGGGTETGVFTFWQKAIAEKQHWDHVFIYSDMQVGHNNSVYGSDPKQYGSYAWGGDGRFIHVPKLIKEYRNKVNKNVMVYCIQVNGYTDTIVPEFYDKTFILGGWSDGVIRFAANMSKMCEQK